MQEVKSLLDENVWLWHEDEDEDREREARMLSMRFRSKREAMGCIACFA